MTGEPELDVTGPQPAVPEPPAPDGSGTPEAPTQSSGTAEFAQVDEAAAPDATAQAGPSATKLDVRDPAEGDEADSAPTADPREAVTGFPGIQQNGMLLANRYRLSERIATGGMGQVWRATDELLGRPVAVKLLSARHAADEHFRIRFRAEAQYAGSLSHRGIARVYDYGESGEGPGEAGPPGAGVPYLVMELVEGEALSAAIARDGRLPVDVTLDIVAQAARALAAAHAAGIIHRDIKPGNLLLTPEGQVKITDFGIARAVQGTHLTQTGMVMGTAQYVSPEQASARPVTAAADIYSLGVVAYECLAGHPPFTAEAPIALALAHVNQQPPPLPDDVPAPVAALVGQMLAKDPAARPASANAVADRASALRTAARDGEDPWLTGPAELANPAAWFADPPTTPGKSQDGPAAPGGTAVAAAAAGPPERRHRRLTQVLVAAAVVLVAAVGIVLALAAGKPAASPDRVQGTPTHHPSVAHTQRSSPTPAANDTGSVPPEPSPSPSASSAPASSPATPSSPASPTASSSPSPSTSGSGSPSPTNSPTATPTSPGPTPTQSTTPAQAPQARSQTVSAMTQDG